MNCEYCHKPLTQERSTKRFCNSTCRAHASLEREKGQRGVSLQEAVDALNNATIFPEQIDAYLELINIVFFRAGRIKYEDDQFAIEA